MYGSKNEFKRRRYERKYGKWSSYWTYDYKYQKKLRKLDVNVDIGDGSHYRKFSLSGTGGLIMMSKAEPIFDFPHRGSKRFWRKWRAMKRNRYKIEK